MPHQDTNGRSRSLQKSFKASVTKQRKAVSRGKAKLSRSRKDIQKAVKSAVEKELGLTTFTASPRVKEQTLALNLRGKDQQYYGIEASAAVDRELRKYKGTQYRTTSGAIVGGNVMTKKAMDLKYGVSGGAMGSGDPTGALSSIPISRDMLRTQNKIKTFILGAIGLATPTPMNLVAKLGMAKTAADLLQPEAAYIDYKKKFAATQAGKKFTSTRNLFGVLGLQHQKKALGQ